MVFLRLNETENKRRSKYMKKIKISSEVAYFAAIALLSLAVAILTAANLGISMIGPSVSVESENGRFDFRAG